MTLSDASTRLQKLLEEAASREIELPLIHITDAYSFTSILAPKRLDPQPCEVFNEPLTYFFYGRPAYRTKHKGSNYINANLPVAMVFHPGKIEQQIKRVFPFDTGAFKIGLYGDFFHSGSKIEHFELDPTIGAAQKIIAYFYTENREYFYGGSRKNVQIPPLNFEAEGIFELARTSAGAQKDGSFKPDLRSSSIEIQVDQTIDVTDSLLGLIVPQIFLDDDFAKKSIAEISPKYLEPYTGIHNLGSDSMTGMLFEKVAKIYQLEKIL